MARPAKHTVDYFPHDAHASEGDTLAILEGLFGVAGYAFWFKLLERLSCAENHVIDVRNPAKWELLAVKTRVTPDICTQIMEKLAELEAIDPDLWRNQRIIWCQKLVDRLSDAYRNRKNILPQKPIINVINPIINAGNLTEAALPTSETPQKEKENKKENKRKIEKRPPVKTTEQKITEVRSDFKDIPDVDWEIELKRWRIYWYEGQQTPPVNVKLSIFNWMQKVRQSSVPSNGRPQRPNALASTENLMESWA